MGLGPETWGPPSWRFIHFITLGYPKNPSDNDKNNYKLFLTMISNILPCSICNSHFKENLIKYPLSDEVLSTRINLFNWSIDMHNEVNKSHSKKTISYEEGLDIYYNSNIDNIERISNTSNINNSNESQKDSQMNKIMQIKQLLVEQKQKQKQFEQKQKQLKKQENNYKYYIIIFIIFITIILFLYYNIKKR